MEPVKSSFRGFVLVVATILPNHVGGEILGKAPLAVGEMKSTLSLLIIRRTPSHNTGDYVYCHHTF